MIDETPRTREVGGGLTVVYRGKYLYSPQNPKANAEKRVRNTTLQPQTLIVVPSPLLFYGIDSLLDRLPEQCHLLCIEIDQQLMALSLSEVPRKLLDNPRISYIRTESSYHVRETLQNLGTWHFRRTIMVRPSGGYTLNRELYNQFFNELEHEIHRYWQNKMTLIHMAQLWFSNIIKNLPRLCASYQLPLGCVDKPVLVIGAGESLEHSLSLIRRLRDALFILCVDTALPVLRQHNIAPDAVCIVEAQTTNTKDIIGADPATTVFCDLSSNHSVLEYFTDNVFFFFSRFTQSALFDRMQEYSLLPADVPPLGSVGVTALYLASRLTEKSVFFTGLDFAYQPGKPHCRGAPSHTELLLRTTRLFPPLWYVFSLNRPLIKTEDKNGRQCITDLVLHSYIHEIKSLTSSGGTSSGDTFYDIGKNGLDTGATNIQQEDEIIHLVHAAAHGEPHNEDPVSTDRENGGQVSATFLDSCRRSAADLSHLDDFFANELSLIKGCITEVTDFLYEGEQHHPWAGVCTALENVDYIYAHFPDPYPLPVKESGFLKRALNSAYHYRELLLAARDRF